MQNSIWKLSALGGVVALGLFAVLQTQRGLQDDAPVGGKKAAAQGTPPNAQTRKNPISPYNNTTVALGQAEPPGGANDPFSMGSKSGTKPDSGAPGKVQVPTIQFGSASKDPFDSRNATKKSAEPKSPPKNDVPLFDLSDNQQPVKSAAGSKTVPPRAGQVKVEKSDPFGTPVPKSKTASGQSGSKTQPNEKKADDPFGSAFPARSASAPPAKKESVTPFPGKASETPPAGTKTPEAQSPKGGSPFDAPPTRKKEDDSPPLLFDDSKTNTKTPPAKEAGPMILGGPPKKEEPKVEKKQPDLPDFGSLDAPPAKKSAGSEPPRKETPPSTPFGSDLGKKEPKSEQPPAKKGSSFPLPPSPMNETSPPAVKNTATTPRLIPESKAEQLPAGKSASTQTPVNDSVSRTTLTIEKTAPQNAVLGKPFIYNILIKNRGASTAHQVVVEDPIPSGVRLEGSDPQAFLSNNKLIWKLGKMAAGETRKIAVKVTPVRTGQIGSIATVNFVSEVAAKPVATPKRANLSLQFDGPNSAKMGEVVSFRFKVNNNGDADATDVWIRDVIPDGLQHPAGDDLEYKIGTLGPGQSKEVTLKMTVMKPGRLTNRAIVTAAGGVQIESKVVVAVNAPKIIISRSGPRSRYVGIKAVYQNMVTNGSTAKIPGAQLTETIPAGMDFIQASGNGRYDASRRIVTWDIGELSPRQSKTVQLVLMPKQTGLQQSIVQARVADGTVAETSTTTTVQGFASLGIDVPAVERPVMVGEQVSYRIVGRNRGTAATSNVQLKVTLPTQLTLVGIRGKGRYTTRGRTITFDPITSLGPNEGIVFDLVLKASAAGDSRVQVQIQSEDMTKPLTREEAVLILPKQ